MSQMEYKDYNSFAMDQSGSISYICDIENHDVIYLSKAGMNAWGIASPEEYRGQKCYKVLQGLDAPCPFCTNQTLSEGNLHTWDHYNKSLGKWLEMTDTLVRLEGRLCRLEIARDITERKLEVNKLTKQLSMEDVLFHCLNTLTREQDLGKAFHRFLELVGGYYHANRAYVIEFHLDTQLADNTFEWCAEGVSAKIDHLKNIPLSIMDFWIKKFESTDEFSLISIKESLPPDAKDREVLEAQGVTSVLGAPLRRDGKIVGFVGVDNPHKNEQDLTLLQAVSGFVLEELEKRRMTEELEQLSYVDMLTGLKNRNRYMRVLREHEIRPPLSLGVIVLDINGMRETNDTHGFEYGDRVLKQAAAIMLTQFPQSVYRVGGDEFVVLCENISKEDFQYAVAALRTAFDRDKICDMSIGFAWNMDEDYVDVNTLCQQAYEMRHAEKQTYYHTVLNEGLSTPHTAFLDDVLKEIEEQRFMVYYQPQVNIKTGTVIGAEALVRKKADDGRIISPQNFIPYYEVGGVISHVDLYVLRTACHALRQWLDQGYDLHISVNFSRVTLLDPAIADLIVGICEEERVPPSAISIEVTESIGKMDGDYLKNLICTLKNFGFSLSLDDFGSQYSNLAILSAMDFDEVKFDRSLVSRLEDNEKSRIVMRAGLELCRDLRATTSLAEGIETPGQLKLLGDYQCDYGQGYYFSKPVPHDQFDAYLKQNRS